MSAIHAAVDRFSQFLPVSPELLEQRKLLKRTDTKFLVASTHIDAMLADTGIQMSKLRVDGGGSQNSLLMQFQSDMLGVDIERSTV